MSNEPYELGNLRVFHQTSKAILVGPPDAEDDDEKYWIPKSLVLNGYGYEVTGNNWSAAIAKQEIGAIDVPEWWAEQEGLA